VPSEPVFREEKTKQRAKESIKLRYSLMPYHYTMVFENNQNGTPLMRPVFFEDTTKPELLEYKASYFWGPDFLVSPITDAGVTVHEVYFPANNNWYDFYTDEKIDGGQYKTVALTMEKIPTYVRGGAIIPRVKPVQTSQLYTLNHVDLHYYFDASVSNSTAALYNDDGMTPEAYEKGMFEITDFSSEATEEGITFEIATDIGENYNFEKKHFNLKIHNIKQTPASVKGYNYHYNKESKILEVKVPYLTKSTKSIYIKF
jgi:alpha-glucosidase (family GH31 glycosyl hydrolase)